MFDFLLGIRKFAGGNGTPGSSPVRGVTSVFVLTGVIFILALPFVRGRLNTGVSLEAVPVDRISVVVTERYRQDPAIALALSDLQAGFTTLYGVPFDVLTDDRVQELPPHAIVIGDKSNKWIKTLVDAQSFILPDLAEEGYMIQRVTHKSSPVIVVAGKDFLGNAYGIFELLERSQIEPRLPFSRPLAIKMEPKMTLRFVSSPTGDNYPSPEEALRWGYNAVAIQGWTDLVLYDGFDKAIMDPARFPAERAWVEERRQKARDEIARAKKLHLKVVSPGDVLSFPKRILDLYKGQVAHDNDPGHFCPLKPKTQQLLDYSLQEVMSAFPQIDVFLVRTGENYSTYPLTGNPPTGGNCATCQTLTPNARLKLVVDLLYNRIVKKGGKTYIQRAWDLGDKGFHADPKVAQAIIKDIPVDSRFMVSFKQTQTDFWRFNTVNPNIASGGAKQMMEFQAAREYEGKGAFPNYLGEIFAYGGKEIAYAGGIDYAYQRGVRTVWVWAKGGGWGGPDLKTDLWVDVNVYAASRLAWEPLANPHSIAEDWATIRFGKAAAPKITDMLMKSDDAVLKAFYIGPFARTNGGWTPNNLWVRDDTILGGDQVKPLYVASKKPADFDAALEEKKQAVLMVDSMIADYKEAMPLIADKKLAGELYNSLLYEKYLLEVFQHYFAGLFNYYRWADGGRQDESIRQAATKSLQSWDASWSKYNNEVAAMPGVASPFRDHGMVAAATGALKEMQQQP